MLRVTIPAVLAALVLCQPIRVRSQAADKSVIAVHVNGQSVTFDRVTPERRGNAIMIPLREVIRSVGGAITWDAAHRTVGVATGDSRAQLKIGSRLATVDGRTTWLDAPPYTRFGETMVPVRFISQAFDADVAWDLASNIVTVQTRERAEPKPEITVTAYVPPRQRNYRRTASRASAVDTLRVKTDTDYETFLRFQDYLRYLADRVSWIRDYQAYRERFPLSASDRDAGLESRYMAFLRYQDKVVYESDQLSWQRNYDLYLRQKRFQAPTDQSARMKDYIQDRNTLMEQTDRMVK